VCIQFRHGFLPVLATIDFLVIWMFYVFNVIYFPQRTSFTSVVDASDLWTGNNAMAAGGGEGRRQEHATSRWRGAGADRYRGPSYDAYNDATRRYPEQSQHQQQPSHLWYPPATNNRESPTSSSSTSSTSAAEDSAGSRRALHHQRQRRHRGDDDADDDTRFFVAFTFVLELLIIIGLALLEYFLRSVLPLATPYPNVITNTDTHTIYKARLTNCLMEGANKCQNGRWKSFKSISVSGKQYSKQWQCFCRAMLCIARLLPSPGVRPSVRLSVSLCHVPELRQNE